MNRPLIRLGPLAVLLTVVAISLSTLAILTFSTARADKALAERFASSVKIRYELEKEGNRFIERLYSDPAVSSDPSVTIEDDRMVYTLSKEGYTLTITAAKDGGALSKWQIRKEWEHEDRIDNLWGGD